MNLYTSIIIVNHNTKDFLGKCIDSIFKYESPKEFEIVIIDNASIDESIAEIEKLKLKYCNIKSVYLYDLKGFAFANNRGIEISSGEYILIMNPDIVLESPILNSLTLFLRNNKNVGAICPALFYPDGEFQKVYYQRYPSIKQFIVFYSPLNVIFKKIKYFVNNYVIENNIKVNEKKIFYVEHIPGAFFLTKRDILNDIGMMDENFILFYEDVDLSYRIHKYYKIAIDTNLRVKHYGASSTKGNWQLHGRLIISMIYFFKKHYSKISYIVFKNIAISMYMVALIMVKSLNYLGLNDNDRIKKYSNFLKLSKDV